MRTRTAGEIDVLNAAFKSIPHTKVEIRNAGGSYVDWFAYLLGVNWGASIDQPIAEARLQLRRDNGPTLSLSPFRGDSTLNIGGAAIDAGRDFKLSPATVAWDTGAQAADYKLLFIGKTADIDFANSAMEILARDQGGTLVKAQIRIASEFKSEAGQPLQDVMQSLLDTWAPGVTLSAPVPPGFLVKSINWGKGSLFEALRTAAGSIGWDVRYVWNPTLAQFSLTLFEPPRTKVVPDWTFAKNRILKVTQLRISDEFIRNYIVVSYLDSDTGIRSTVTVSDPVSIARFGEQWAEFEEADDSPINTNTEAFGLAEAALSDLAWPIAEKQVEVPFFWPVEIGDLIRFTADDIWSDEDVDLAVTGFEHRLGKEARTVLSVRGKPAGFYKDWIRRSKSVRPDVELENDLALNNFREIARTDVSVTYGWTPGPLVESVFIFDRLVAEPLNDDPWPTSADAPTSILAVGVSTYEAMVPLIGELRVLQFEPRASAAAGYKAGQIRRVTVGAPAPVISAVLDAVETNALVDLTLQVRATPQAYPITATVYENTKTGTLLATHVFSADATITKLDYALLGSRATAAADKKFWYAKLIDVAGSETWVSDFVSVPGTGSIKLASQFAAAIVPPEIVGALPTLPHATYPAGRLVVLTTDSKLYRSTGTAWTKATDGADIIANSIVAGTLAAGAISADTMFATGVITSAAIATDAITTIKIAADQVTADKIGVSELSAISADLGEITAGEMHNAADTAGVLLDGSLPGTWTRYLDLTADAGDSFLKHDKLTLKYDGTAKFQGVMELLDSTGGLAGKLEGTSSGAGQSTLTITAAYDVILTLAGIVGSGASRVASIAGAAWDCQNGLSVSGGFSQLFKEPGLTHGMTTVAATDTAATVEPDPLTTGGLRVQGTGTATTALTLASYGTGDITTKTTAALASTVLSAAKASGTGIANLAANSNILAVRNNATTRFILDGDGDSHQDVGTAWTNFDAHDDVALLNCLAAEVSRPDDPVRAQLAGWLDQNRPQLEHLKLVSFEEDGHPFVNMSRLNMLLVGAVRQLAGRLEALEARAV